MDRQFTARKPSIACRRNSPAQPLSDQLISRRASQLQRLVGNGEMSRANPRATATLRIGAPGDRYEREADRVADQVMRSPISSVRGQAGVAAKPVEGPGEALRCKCAGCSAGDLCSKCAADQDEPLRRKARDNERNPVPSGTLASAQPGGTEVAVSSELKSDISAMRGGGTPMSAGLRAYFEPRFGHSFANVRVHTDGQAARTADALQARAYTTGSNVAFAAGQYQPNSEAGRRLMAHELAHVVQQSGCTNTVQRFAYGAGNHLTGGGNTFSEITAAEREGANGFDRAMAIVDRVTTGQGWRANTCQQWYADNCTDVPTPTAQDLHNRARIWMWRFADGAPRAGNNGLTDGANRENHAINERVFNNRSRWEIAAVMVHEYWHDCEHGQPDIGDGAKIACGLPNT